MCTDGIIKAQRNTRDNLFSIIVRPTGDEQEEVPEDEPEEELGSENLEDTENHGDTEVNEESDLEELDWRKLPSIDVYHKLYGYNISDIVYRST